MSLEIVDVYKGKEISIQRYFESMGENLLLIKIEFFSHDRSPYHWFLESGKKPPLDVAIDRYTGFISCFQLFFQDEKIIENEKKIKIEKNRIGIPRFNISIFNDKRFYCFKEGKEEAFLKGKDLYIVIENCTTAEFLYMDKNNVMLFSENGKFVGVILKNLLNDEIKSLKDSKILE